MFKKSTKVYTTTIGEPVGEATLLPKNSRLRHRPRRTPTMRITRAIRDELEQNNGKVVDYWDFEATREDYTTFYQRVLGVEIEALKIVPEKDICMLCLLATERAYASARKVEKEALKTDPSLGYMSTIRQTSMKMASLMHAVHSGYNECGLQLYEELHDRIIDFIAKKI